MLACRKARMGVNMDVNETSARKAGREDDSLRAGFIGLGSQGGPMARRIADSGIPLTLWARRPESLEAFADSAASVAKTPAEVAARSDVVGICVVADADVRAVVDGPDGVLAGLRPGGILCLHSTIHPDTCAEIGERAAAQDVEVLDAPVSGGGLAAAEKRLVVMVGGSPHSFKTALPVLETFGDPVRLLGPLGSGTRVKLINNLLMTAMFGLGEEALGLAAAIGADRQAVAEVVAGASGGSLAMRTLTGFTLEEFIPIGGKLLSKDAHILYDVASAAGVDLTGFAALQAAADRSLRVFEQRREP